MKPTAPDTVTSSTLPTRGSEEIHLPRDIRWACAWSRRFLIASFSFAAALMLYAASAQGQVMDTSLWMPNRGVNAIVRGGNTIYVGGAFTVIGPLTGAGVPLDGGTGVAVTPFPRVEGGDGQVIAVIPDGAGGWYIGGRFATVGGIPRSNLAHILADGSVGDWDPGPTGTSNPGESSPQGAVFALAVSGSTVYVGGDFTTIGGQARSRLAALDATTGLATAWSPRPNGWVESIEVGGNTVYVGGGFSGLTIGEVFWSRPYLAALDATTGALLPFAPYPSGNPVYVEDLILSGDILYVAGYFDWIGGQPRNNIAGLDATTGMATAWDPNADGPVRALALSGNTVYAAGGGSLTWIGGAARNRIAALDATTGLATPWNPDANGTVWALAVNGSTVYAGGYFTHIGGQDRSYLASLDAATGLATPWDPVANDPAYALATDSGKVYAGGDFWSVGGERRNRIAALDAATGSLTAWNPDANNPVGDLAVVGNTVYACGSFTTIGGHERRYVAALDATTGHATQWVPDAIDRPVGIMAASTSTVYIGNQDYPFTSIGGQARKGIGALDAVTGTVTPWNPDPGDPEGWGTYIYALEVDESAVYVGGGFATIGGQVRRNLAALDPTTGAATPWNPNPNSVVTGMELSGNTVYVGGYFTAIGEQSRNYLAALDATTGDATTWDPNANGDVRAIAVSGNTIYVASPYLLGIGGQARGGIAAIDAASGSVTAWNPGVEEHGVGALAVCAGRVYVGGAFHGIGGQSRPYLAAFVEDGSTPVLVSVAFAEAFPDRVNLAWDLGGTVVSLVAVQRSEVPGEWRTLHSGALDGTGRVRFTDRDVEPGRRYGYRLGFFVDGVEAFGGDLWAEVPAWALSLRGASPNPSAGRLAAQFTLPVHAPAILELVDVAGRRITAREVGSLGTGAHTAEMTPEGPLPAGLYWLRLTQRGKALTAKLAVVR